MKCDTPLDCAVFQLSPKRSRCELLVFRDGNVEKLASGLLKPFVTHLKVAEEQAARSVQSIKLEVERRKNAESWFTKRTLERFVRFVSTPEILELANTFDAEMSQLESARRIYLQGPEDQHSGAGGGGSGITVVADATKKELLRAIDVRLVAVQHDLTTACARATAAGFSADTISDLQKFADCFGARRLNEACCKFLSLCERRPDLINAWKAWPDDQALRSSYGSDMSIDEEAATPNCSPPTGSCQPQGHDRSSNLGELELEEADAAQTQQLQHQECHHHNLFQSEIYTVQHQPKSSFSRCCISESSVEPDDRSSIPRKRNDTVVEKEKKEESSSNITSVNQPKPITIQASQPARRLSVQDRINLFENKQKENSASGGKPAAIRSVELQRLSSDVSSAPGAMEKAVLRRWSGASDMSIDLSGEKKDIESPLCTPSSSCVSQLQSEDYKDVASSIKPESRILSGRLDHSRSKNLAESQPLSGKQLTVSSGKLGDAFESEKSNSILGAVQIDGWNDQAHGKTQLRSVLNKAENNNPYDQANSVVQFRSLPAGNPEQGASIYQPKLKDLETGVELVMTKGLAVYESLVARQKEEAAPQLLVGAFASKESDISSSVNLYQPGQIEFPRQKEEIGVRDQSSRTHFWAAQRSMSDSSPPENVSGSRIREAFASQYRVAKGNSSSSQPMAHSFVETEEVQKRVPGERLSGSSALKFEDSEPRRMKFEKQFTATEQIKKAQGRRNDSVSFHSNNKATFSTKMASENQEGTNSFSTPFGEHVQRPRQSKGNQDLNDELKMKASELEKLFAEHKLQLPCDQSSSIRKSRLVDRQTEPPSIITYRKPSADIAPSHLPENSLMAGPTGSSKNAAKYNEIPVMKMVYSHSDTPNENFVELNFLEGAHGKFYERYIQKREAKLREEWGAKGAEKEAKLKAMQDTLERSTAEMKAKFSGLTNSQDSVSSGQRRAERLRSFNSRSIMRREQLKYSGEDGPVNETSFADSLSRSMQIKKVLPTKSLSSFTCTPAAPVPWSTVRASNNFGLHRMQSENPLAQSVPDLSDFRKENTKPSSVASKTVRPQMRNCARNKSPSEEMSFAKEEKSRRSQSLRKSSANPVDFSDMSTLNYQGDSLTTNFHKEEIDQSCYDKYSETWGSKPFSKKVSDIDSGARASRKTSMAAEALNDGREYNDLGLGPEDPEHFFKDEKGEEFEKEATPRYSNIDDWEPELEQDSEKFNLGFENGVSRSCPHMDSSLVAELPANVPPDFTPIENVQDSPGESPVSWNPRAHHPFAYSHEMSGTDASVDSPVGSTASWNAHSLIQTETDSAWMRKKCVMAQKPMLVANSFHNQSHEDMTRGFKRLLKFGRKSRSTDSVVDWISATTTEGDDDTEDGHDPANRSSEDLWKSSVGSFQGHPVDDNPILTELHSSTSGYNFKLTEDHLSGSSIKAPRSFFLVSSFRSRTSHSTPRRLSP